NGGNNDTTSRASVEEEPSLPVRYADIALSNRFVEEHGADLRHVANGDTWFIYQKSEGRWAEDEKMLVFTWAKRTLVKAAREAYDEIFSSVLAKTNDPKAAHKAAAPVASALASAPKVAAVVKLACSHPKIAFILKQFDTNRWLLNTPGGTVDLKTGTLRPATREDYFTKSTIVAPK